MTTKLSNDLLSGNASYRNRLINSSFQINQRNAGTQTIGASFQYPVDCWHSYEFATGSVNSAIATATPAPNLRNYLTLTCTLSDTLSSNEYGYIAQIIEGNKLDDLGWGTVNAQPLVVSFWVRANFAAAYGGALFSYGSSRSFAFNYTINSANTWEFKTVVITPDSVALPTGTSAALRLAFTFGSGSGSLTASSGWTSGTYFGLTGASSIFTATRNLWFAGIQLEAGGSSSPFQYKSYAEELLECQRYYFRQKATATSESFFLPANIVSTTAANGLIRFPASMRIAPTALEQSGTAGNYAINSIGSLTACSSVPTFGQATTVGATIGLTVASGLTAGQAGHVSSSAASGTSAYLGWSAEFV